MKYLLHAHTEDRDQCDPIVYSSNTEEVCERFVMCLVTHVTSVFDKFWHVLTIKECF